MTPLQLVHPVVEEPELDLCAPVAFREADADDAAGIHGLITRHQAEGHLLPRSLGDVARHAGRFLVASVDGAVVACGELAPLSFRVAEIRSLVVDPRFRRRGIGEQIFETLKRRAERHGFEKLCAFTHEPRFFIRLGFSIVPHTWLPEKIAVDCHSCSLFRRCGQFAMLIDLEPPARHRGGAACLFS
jgi:amino-acid N-acetyltransferase